MSLAHVKDYLNTVLEKQEMDEERNNTSLQGFKPKQMVQVILVISKKTLMI